MDDDLTPNPSDLSFGEVLNALRDEENLFPARYLYRLSGLEGEELHQLSLTWGKLAFERRLRLLEDLELLAESNTVLEFSAVNRIALNDQASEVRVVAIRSLWLSEHVDLVHQFIELLQNDEDTAVRAQAAAALGRFIYLGELGKMAAGTLKEIETLLLRILEDDVDTLIQRRALEALGYSSRPNVAELIQDAYQGGQQDWMESALFAMGRSADDRWEPMIVESLQDSNPDFRREAAKAAGELELAELTPDLIELLEDEDSEVRLAAGWSLSQIGGQGVAEALQGAMESTEDQDEIDLFEDALDNLAFTEEMGELNLMDFSPEDLEEFTSPNGHEDESAEESDLE